jgi:hypothetical protein
MTAFIDTAKGQKPAILTDVRILLVVLVCAI